MFPVSAADLTTVWLQQVLRQERYIGEEHNVASHRATPIGDGLAGEVHRITLTYDRPSTAPKSLIAKFATRSAVNLDTMTTFNLYQREVHFYRHYSHRVRLRVPRCLFNAVSADGRTFILLLEDFPGHASGDQTHGCSDVQAKLCVAAAAQLHAQFWGDAGSVEGLQKHGDFYQLRARRLDRAWSAMSERYGDLVPREVIQLREHYLDSFLLLPQWVLAGPTTVTHGDFRITNFLFGPIGSRDPVVILDWQLLEVSRGIGDVSYLLTQSISTEQRRSTEKSLLATYSQTLARYGIDYSMEQCWNDYRMFALINLASAVGISSLEAKNEATKQFVRLALERGISAFLDVGAAELLRQRSWS